MDRALLLVVADSSRDLKLRLLAARLLRDIGGDNSAFCPLLSEFIGAGDDKLPQLCRVISSMRYGGGRLADDEYEMLQQALRKGTPQERYWVVNEIAFFIDDSRVARALIEVLDDTAAPGYVRAWAAERLNMHASQVVVSACLRVIEDPYPEVRFWAVYTLGCAASSRSRFRPSIIPVLERKLSDDAVVPGWWSVSREAQAQLASLRGGEEADRLQQEVQAILRDDAASAEEKFWAGFYDYST